MQQDSGTSGSPDKVLRETFIVAVGPSGASGRGKGVRDGGNIPSSNPLGPWPTTAEGKTKRRANLGAGSAGKTGSRRRAQSGRNENIDPAIDDTLDAVDRMDGIETGVSNNPEAPSTPIPVNVNENAFSVDTSRSPRQEDQDDKGEAHQEPFTPDPSYQLHNTEYQDPPSGQSTSETRQAFDIRQQQQRNRRELSSTKRAAQNREAQRAFRQRKEGHIKDLEQQLRDYNVLFESYKELEAENITLREYVATLQHKCSLTEEPVPTPPREFYRQPALRSFISANHASPTAQAHHNRYQPSHMDQLPGDGRVPILPMPSPSRPELQARGDKPMHAPRPQSDAQSPAPHEDATDQFDAVSNVPRVATANMLSDDDLRASAAVATAVAQQQDRHQVPSQSQNRSSLASVARQLASEQQLGPKT